VVQIKLPALRDRTDDVPLLVDHFLTELSERKHIPPHRVSSEVMHQFMAYHWPGNVRELRNKLESMMIMADGEVLTEKDLPAEILMGASGGTSRKELPTNLTMEELEKLAITKALDECGGNRTHAAEQLDISVRTLQRKLRQYAMEKGRNGAQIKDVLTEA
jgi:DNA-binding NtrC family response regulator